jgi:hypothetical protein
MEWLREKVQFNEVDFDNLIQLTETQINKYHNHIIIIQNQNKEKFIEK